jgi:D-arabinose 5-phosphate isomerase GutQ
MKENSFFDVDLGIISKSLKSINSIHIERIVDDCYKTSLNGNKIIATGLGKNVSICEKFVGTLSSLGIKSQFIHTNSAIHGDLGVIKDHDLIIILSKSGLSEETIYLYSILGKFRNIKIWIITFNSFAPIKIQNKNNLIISLLHEGDKWNLIPNNSTTIFLILLQKIAILLTYKLKMRLAVFKKNHPGGHIGFLLNKVK